MGKIIKRTTVTEEFVAVATAKKAAADESDEDLALEGDLGATDDEFEDEEDAEVEEQPRKRGRTR